MLTGVWPIIDEEEEDYQELYKDWEFDEYEDNLKHLTPKAKTFLSNML